MLYRMYNKWAQAHGMTVEVLDYQDGDEAGLKSASMMVKGANAYGLLLSLIHILYKKSISVIQLCTRCAMPTLAFVQFDLRAKQQI